MNYEKTNVYVDNDVLYNLLVDRADYWRDPDSETAKLFYKMYEHYVDSGLFEGSEFDPMKIVDNDIVNWCSVVEKGEKDFDKLLELYHKGEYDVSCEDFEEYKVSFIEAVSDDEDLILIRY